MKYLIRAISIKNYKFIYQDDNFIENYEKRLRQIRKDEAQRPKTQEELAKIAQEKAEKPIKDAQEVQKIIKKYPEKKTYIAENLTDEKRFGFIHKNHQVQNIANQKIA
jgi:hypothetical protein